MKLNFMTDQGSILESTSWASRRTSAPSFREVWVAGEGEGARFVAGLVFTAATAAAPAMIAAPCRAEGSGFRFFVAVPNGDLSLDTRSSDHEDLVSAEGALLATTRPGSCAVSA
jgi:hypothetical protein